MATIPTYRDLEDRIEVLEGKLRYWSNLSNLNADESLASIINSNQEQVVADIKSLCKKAFEWDEGGLSSFEPEFDKVHWVTNDDGTECQVQHIMKTEEWDDERMDIIGQNGNDGLHYNEDKEGM